MLLSNAETIDAFLASVAFAAANLCTAAIVGNSAALGTQLNACARGAINALASRAPMLAGFLRWFVHATVVRTGCLVGPQHVTMTLGQWAGATEAARQYYTVTNLEGSALCAILGAARIWFFDNDRRTGYFIIRT